MDIDNLCNLLVNEWKDIIESINVDGYSRKVESNTYFQMSGSSKICYKVNFNFPLEQSDYREMTEGDDRYDRWCLYLEEMFTKIFYSEGGIMPQKGYNYGEIKFDNDKVDYMTNQGYRFIVQFYPEGFISYLRDRKLDQLGV